MWPPRWSAESCGAPRRIMRVKNVPGTLPAAVRWAYSCTSRASREGARRDGESCACASRLTISTWSLRSARHVDAFSHGARWLCTKMAARCGDDAMSCGDSTARGARGSTAMPCGRGPPVILSTERFGLSEYADSESGVTRFGDIGDAASCSAPTLSAGDTCCSRAPATDVDGRDPGVACRGGDGTGDASPAVSAKCCTGVGASLEARGVRPLGVAGTCGSCTLSDEAAPP
mmetsp:Transcript_28081/g.87004  ORF Transcript_28081/g.87004 Transcript_28081/m.87004 type:complete len:231 (-) Transcript_28081:230-922(-)